MNNILLKKWRVLLLLSIGITFSSLTWADATRFQDGPLIKGYGKHAKVNQTMPMSKNMILKVAFDLSKQGKDDAKNRSIDSLARFLNMHVANGVLAKNIELALVVHGKAGFDLLSNESYQKKFSKNNPNQELLAKLMKNKVKVYLCGQSAAYYDIENEHLQQGVIMALSAMSAHAMLQQEGYTLNPF
jgi:intracellular sulfur oxidation DsrE/DsrF family protein